MDAAVLHAGGVPVARYVWRPDLPVTDSPRPYLHPVRTLAGTPVTEFRPDDHVHHLGASVAVGDVGGANFWGGRTYVTGQGPTWLDNHGEQRHTGFARQSGSGFVETLDWLGPDGRTLVREQRTVEARPAGPGGWALDVTFVLTNVTGRSFTIQSSATKGRAGAGYGGFFWRAPKAPDQPRVFTADAEGEDAVHGSTARWLALAGRSPTGQPWTLAFVQPDDADPWFVRVVEYPGVGPALAWDRPLPVDTAVTRRVVTLVLDGHPGRNELARLVGQVSG